jgi:ATP/maltotriose-dependent transcriptional regulator MalT/DNA-binding SARP family transcriptional activator
MSTRLPSQKFIPPHFPSNALHRDSLVKTLQEVISPLVPANNAPLPQVVLLCAPAGYGKTTLLADFAQSVAIPCCWYHLEPEDMDVYAFLNSLIESIHQRFPQFGKTLIDSLKQLFSGDALSQKGIPHLKEFINTLLLEIDTSIFERFIIFFCNYHEINESDEISVLVNWMIKHLPEQCVIGIESRAIPALDLTSMLSQRKLFGLGSNNLRFTPEDICHLARQQKLELSLEEATELHRSFDGWIAGILLGTRLGEKFFSPALGSGMSWSVPALRMDRQNLLAYLVDRVFKQEPEIYTFLQETSLFLRLTPELCDRLMERTDAAAYLASIEHQGFFLTHTEDQLQVVYTCHPILRELLYQELRQEAPQRFISLHQRAAQIFYEMKEYEQSITYALTAEAYHLAASTLAEIAKRLIQQGRSDTVARWIDQLPSGIQQHYPALMLARAYIYAAQGETDKALPLLDQLYLLICPNGVQADDSTTTVLAEICIIRSVVAYNMGNYAEVQALCEKALKLLPADERELRALAYQRLGVYASFLGDSSTGIAQMQKALQLWGHNTEALQTALLHGNLATAYSMVGNYALAEHHRSRAITTYDRLGDMQGKINSMVGMAIAKRNKGSLDEAEKGLQEALALSRQVHFQRSEAYALANLGNVYQDQGRLQEALVAIEDCLNLARQLQDKYLMNLTTNTLAMTYLFMGDPQTALFHIGTTDIQAKETMSYEWMVLELTRGTILLYLQQYAEARSCLLAVQNAFNKAQFKNLYISSLIRLAMCQLSLNQQEEAFSLVRQAELLAARENCEHLVHLELSRLPVLQHALQRQPASVVQVYAPPKKPTSLRAVALGEPTIFIDEVPITRWRMARSLELYFFLIDYGRPARKEQIITALWHDVDDNSDQTLRSAIYYLRKTIGDVCITYCAGAYNLDHTSVYGEQVQYDVSLFLAQYQEAKNALALGHEADAESALLLMMDLYQGDYVQAFYSDWCSHRRDELRRIYMDARSNLALLTWREERLEECIIHWQHLLAIDNCLEDAHYGLMRCYARQGKRSLALRQYQRCADILQGEFAVPPRPALQKLYQRLSGNE